MVLDQKDSGPLIFPTQGDHLSDDLGKTGKNSGFNYQHDCLEEEHI